MEKKESDHQNTYTEPEVLLLAIQEGTIDQNLVNLLIDTDRSLNIDSQRVIKGEVNGSRVHMVITTKSVEWNTREYAVDFESLHDDQQTHEGLGSLRTLVSLAFDYEVKSVKYNEKPLRQLPVFDYSDIRYST